MTERNKKMGEDLGENWNKNKKKQFRIIAKITGLMIDKVDIEDIAIRISLSR
jgi:hypothetical protein